MKKSIKGVVHIVVIVVMVGFVFGITNGWAANDPSIKGKLREDIMTSMSHFITANTIGGTYHIYDAVDGKLLKLKFKKLHDGIVKKGDYYVSCADFVDSRGRTFDLDFLVMADGENLKTTQAVVHSVDGNKRKYHLE